MTYWARRPVALAFAAATVGAATMLAGCGAAPGTHPAVAAPARTSAGTSPAASPGVWGTAQEVPGTAGLNQGGGADIDSVSCASAGNCSAGGVYVDGSGIHQAFVVSEVNGSWQQAEEVPGSAALNQGGGSAAIFSVSCASAGNCSAGGDYGYGAGVSQAMVVSEVNGTWQQAEEVPGTAPLTLGGGSAAILSVSCASAGNCSAGGDYAGDGSGGAFVVSEVHGTWQQEEEVPSIATLGPGGGASIQSVSCGSAGNCSAGGYYTVSLHNQQAFLVSQVGGTWQQPEEVPGTATLDQGGEGSIDSVSCASAGACSAGGNYTDGSGHQQAFVVSEVSGSWQQAIEVPGTATLNQGNGPGAGIDSVSCASVGNCGAGGYYTDSAGHRQAFVVGEVSGDWQQAEEVPGTATLNQGGKRGHLLGVVRHCGQLQCGRRLHRRVRPPAGVRGRRGQRQLAAG